METNKIANNEIKNKQIIKNKELPKEVKHILKYSIESLFIINNNHINNCTTNDKKPIKTLYIKYFIKDDNVEIKI